MGDAYASCRSLFRSWGAVLAILGVFGIIVSVGVAADLGVEVGQVEAVDVVEVDGGTEVLIRYSGALLEPRSFLLPAPPRLVLDLAGLTETQVAPEFTVAEGPVQRIRTAAYPEKVRVVLATEGEVFPEYAVEPEPGLIRIRLGVGAGAVTAAKPAAPRVEVASVAAVGDAAVAPVRVAPVAPIAALRPVAQISSVTVGAGEVLVRGDGVLDPQVFDLGDGTVALSFENTGLAIGLEGRLDGYDSIESVDVFRSLSSDGRDVRVVVAVAAGMVPRLVRDQGRVTLVAEAAPVAAVKPEPAGALVAAEPVIAPMATDSMSVAGLDAHVEPSSAPAELESSSQVIIAAGRRYTLTDDEPAADAEEAFETDFFKAPSRYVGEKISIDIQDADVQNVLRLLAEISGKNMIIASDVQGQITIKLKDIPWDQVLDLILKTNQLGKEEDGNIIRIATLDTLEDEQEALIKQREREKRLDPVILKIVPVNFASADDMLSQLQSIASDRPDASIDVDERTNSLIVKDTEVVVDVMVDLVRSLDTPTPQVLIEARIVEANINFSRQFGIQWGAGFVASPETGNPVGLKFPNAITLGGFPTGEGEGGSALGGLTTGPSGNPLIVNLPAAVSSDSGGAFAISLQSLDDTFGLDLLISALEDGGHGRLVSSPRIITLDNEEATIEQGFDIPFRTVSEEGAEVSFQSASLELSVTPHITPDESIVMDVTVSNDSPDFSQTVEGNPLVARKSAETQVLIRNGQTAVIGGVFQIDTDINESGVPWLKDLPVLGLFFRRNTEIESKNELIVFITPTIIKRTEG